MKTKIITDDLVSEDVKTELIKRGIDKEIENLTINLVLKWLRVFYDILVVIGPNLSVDDDSCSGSFYAELYQYGIPLRVEIGNKPGDDLSPEEVANEAIMYCLANLI